jgi:mannose-6-phosphate isomerase-like protein (cupin superfamily)
MYQMELNEFLNSGMLELYLINTLHPEEVSLVESMRKLYPEVHAELAKLESFLEEDAIRNAVSPHTRMDEKMALMFNNLEAEQNMQLSATPLISALSNADAWLELVTPLLPENYSGERFEKLLRHENGVMQVLVISATDVEEEVHESLDESFLILKGTCICHIGEHFINMGPGDFMQIPLNLPHTVTITSESITAILQHIS